ncbi:hypothetical protein ACOME3_000183 [Neoechinorhynchus agilis]
MYYDGDFLGQEAEESEMAYLADHGAPLGNEAANGSSSHLTGLEIRGRVSHLSENLWQFTQISRLSLSNNLLTSIPAGIKNMANLTFLDASNNRLESLPRELGDLANLRELIIDGNKIRELPMELGKLRNLVYLSIGDNPLDQHILDIFSREGTAGIIEHLHGLYSQHSLAHIVHGSNPYEPSQYADNPGVEIPLNYNSNNAIGQPQ